MDNPKEMDAPQAEVLIVDDNMENIQIIMNILARRNYELAYATNGKDALLQVERGYFDLILLDIMMPEMDGFEVCKRLKSSDATKEIPIIFVSAQHNTSSIIKGFELGGEDYITKPYNVQELLARMNTHIKLKQYRENMIKQSRYVQMGEMLGMIAHHWRQPLAAISTAAIELSLTDSLGENNSKKTKELTKFIEQKTQFLSKTIDDFSSFFKPETIQEEFFINDLIENITHLLGCPHNGLIIKPVFKSDDQLTFFGFKKELEQALLNLIKNCEDAYSHSPAAEKTIEVEIEDHPNSLSIILKDQAGGINPKIIDKVFDPYFTTKEHGKGIGNSLFMSRSIIEKSFKGSIEIKNYKKGTRCIISLPK